MRGSTLLSLSCALALFRLKITCALALLLMGAAHDRESRERECSLSANKLAELAKPDFLPVSERFGRPIQLRRSTVALHTFHAQRFKVFVFRIGRCCA